MASRKLKVAIKSIFIAFIMAAIILVVYYFYFEATRLQACGVDLFNDWKSYISYVLSKIPYVKDRIKYVPLKIGSPNENYDYILEGYLNDISSKIEKLESERRKLQEEKDLIDKEKKFVEDLKKKWMESLEKLEMEKSEYLKSLSKIKDFSEMLKVADPEVISKTLNQDSISADTIAAALSYLPKDTSAEIIQALSQVNPKKAAEVVNKMSGVEELLKGIKSEMESLNRKIKELVKEEANIVDKKILTDIMINYISGLSGFEIVEIVKDEKHSIDVMAFVLQELPEKRRKDVLNILRKNYPEVFWRLVEKGVKE